MPVFNALFSITLCAHYIVNYFGFGYAKRVFDIKNRM